MNESTEEDARFCAKIKKIIVTDEHRIQVLVSLLAISGI